MEYYGNNDWRDYHLAHYGVLGMKWGVRKQRPTSGGSALSDFVKRRIKKHKIRKAGRKAANRQVLSNVKNAKGLLNKGSELMGYGAAKTRRSVKSDTERKLANASKNKFAKHLHNVRSDNNRYASEYYGKRQRESISDRVINNAFYNKTLSDTKYRRLSGRTTTYGRNWVDNYLTAGTYGLYQDYKYLKGKKKNQ